MLLKNSMLDSILGAGVATSAAAFKKAKGTMQLEPIITILDSFDDIENAAKSMRKAKIDRNTAKKAFEKSNNFSKNITEAMEAFDSFDELSTIKGKIKDNFKSFKENIKNTFTGSGKDIFKNVLTSGLTKGLIGTAVAGLVGYGMYKHYKEQPETKYKELTNIRDQRITSEENIKALNQQLTITGQKIDELQLKGNLSLVEQQDLLNLQLQNEELERTLKIEEARAKLLATEEFYKSKEAYDALTTQKGHGLLEDDVDTSYNEKKINARAEAILETYGGKETINAIKNNALEEFALFKEYVPNVDHLLFPQHDKNNINSLIAEYKGLDEVIKEVNAEIDKMSEDKDISDNESKQIEALEAHKKKVSEEQLEVGRYISEYMKVVNDSYIGYKNAYDLGTLEEPDVEKMSEMQSLINVVSELFDTTGEDITAQINGLLSKASFDGLKEKLIDVGKTGRESLNQLIANTPDLTEALNIAGVSAEQLSDYIMNIADPDALNINKVKETLKDKLIGDVEESAKKARGNIWDQFIQGKSDGDIETFYNYIKDSNLDISQWNLEDLEYNFKISVDGIETVFDANAAIEEFKTSLENAKTTLSGISTALTESNTKTGMSAESVDALTDSFGKLNNFNPEALFINTSNGVKANNNELEALIKSQYKLTNSEYNNAILEQNKLLSEQQQILLNDPTNTVAQERVAEIEKEINVIERLQSQYMALYNEQMRQLSDFNKITLAEQTPNAGAQYDAMLGKIKSAKEAYDKGLINTDDFKSVTAYLSPYDFEDPESFLKGYKKAERYITEDNTGIIKFMDDLAAAGLAAFKTLDDGSRVWMTDFEDMNEAADKMEMGEEFFADMLHKYEEYGGVNTYITSLEEGSAKISETTAKLADEKVKLAELIATGAGEDAISKQQEVVDKLTYQLGANKEALVDYKNQAAKEQINSIKEAKVELDTLSKMIQEETDAGVKEQLKNKFKSIADQYGFKYNDYTLDQSSANELLNKNNIGTIENPLTAEQMGYAKASEEAKSYTDAVNQLKAAHDNNDEAMINAMNTLEGLNAEELKGIVLSDDAYNVTGLENYEDALQNIADKTGLTKDQIISALEGLGVLVKPEVDTSDVEKSATEIEASVAVGKQSLSELQQNGKIELSFDINEDTEGLTVEELRKRTKELAHIRTQFDVGGPEFNAIQSLISGMQAQIHIQTVMDNGDFTFEELKGMDQKTIESKLHVSAPEAEDIYNKIQEMKEGTIPITVKIDEKQFNSLITPEETSEITIDGNNELAKQKADEAREYTESLEPIMKIDGDNGPAKNKGFEAVRTIQSLSPVLKIGGEASGVTDAINAALSGTHTINISANVIGLPSGSSGVRKSNNTGTMTSIARASGTAYNVLNMKPLRAFAKGTGDITLPRNETALVNEEQINGHSESIVRDGKWSLIPGGAHFENLKKGDLIFSARQTEALLKHGQISGHARAYAQGTVSNAYAGGSYGPTLTPKPSVPNNSGSNNQSASKPSKDNTNATNANTSALEALKKQLEKTQDWIEIRLAKNAEKTEFYTSRAESDYIGFASAQKYFDKALSSIYTQINDTKKAKSEYQAHLNNIAKKLGLSKDMRDKIENGKINIEQFKDDKIKEAIQIYSEWYQKLTDCTTALHGFEDQLDQLADTNFQKVMDHYEASAGRHSAMQDYYQALRENRVAHGLSQYPGGDGKKGSVWYQQIGEERKHALEEKKIKENELKKLKKEANDYLKTKGNKKSDLAYKNMVNAMISLGADIVKLDTTAANLEQEMRDARLQHLDWKINAANRKENKHEAMMEYKEVSDNPKYQITEADYAQGIKIDAEQINKLYAKREEILKQYSEAVETSNSELAQKYLDMLSETDQEIIKNQTQIEQKKNAIMELRLKPYYDAQKKLSDVIEEYQTLQKLIGETESFFNDDGSFTTAGLTNITLIQESIDATKTTIANATKQLDILQQHYANGNLSEKEYKERTEEVQDTIRKSAEALSDYKHQILDMYETQVKMENDLLVKNIDKRMEALDAKKE